MEHCEIEIKTHTKGTSFALSRAKGALERINEGVASSVSYPHEGEAGRPSRWWRMRSRWSGTAFLMRFERGKDTSFARLKAGGHEGRLPLRTKFYSLMRGEDGSSVLP